MKYLQWYDDLEWNIEKMLTKFERLIFSLGV